MEIETTEIQGVKILKPKVFTDARGAFIKTYNKEQFLNNELDADFKESYYSISNKNVIRGMHFQAPPHDHTKLVYVTKGSIIDAVLDIRKNSVTYGKYQSFDISEKNGYLVYIPKGCAHGFLALEDNTCVVYMQTSEYNKDLDMGIRVDSFGMDWGIKDPIMSERDKNFPTLKDFNTPFN